MDTTFYSTTFNIQHVIEKNFRSTPSTMHHPTSFYRLAKHVPNPTLSRNLSETFKEPLELSLDQKIWNNTAM